MNKRIDPELKREVEDLVDGLLVARDKLVRAEIDATQCQTRHDWKKLNEAENSYQELYHETVRRLAELAGGKACS